MDFIFQIASKHTVELDALVNLVKMQFVLETKVATSSAAKASGTPSA
jgi:hypothetical protein